MRISREQAYAFIDALTGPEFVSEDCFKAKSPHALCHLEAVLGESKVPLSFEVREALEGIGWGDERLDAYMKTEAFLNYMACVVDTLRRALPEEPLKSEAKGENRGD